MMLKLKTYFTIFVLYEIIAIILLHFSVTCEAMFGFTFCSDSVYKYFVACFAVPAEFLLIVMWIAEIIKRIHHRRSITYKAKSIVKDIVSGVRSKISKNVSSEDLEKIIIATLVAGVKRYSERYQAKKEDVVNAFTDNSENSKTKDEKKIYHVKKSKSKKRRNR